MKSSVRGPKLLVWHPAYSVHAYLIQKYLAELVSCAEVTQYLLRRRTMAVARDWLRRRGMISLSNFSSACCEALASASAGAIPWLRSIRYCMASRPSHFVKIVTTGTASCYLKKALKTDTFSHGPWPTSSELRNSISLVIRWVSVGMQCLNRAFHESSIFDKLQMHTRWHGFDHLYVLRAIAVCGWSARPHPLLQHSPPQNHASHGRRTQGDLGTWADTRCYAPRAREHFRVNE